MADSNASSCSDCLSSCTRLNPFHPHSRTSMSRPLLRSMDQDLNHLLDRWHTKIIKISKAKITLIPQVRLFQTYHLKVSTCSEPTRLLHQSQYARVSYSLMRCSQAMAKPVSSFSRISHHALPEQHSGLSVKRLRSRFWTSRLAIPAAATDIYISFPSHPSMLTILRGDKMSQKLVALQAMYLLMVLN